MSILILPPESCSTIFAHGASILAWPLEMGGRKWCSLSVTCAWANAGRAMAGAAMAAPVAARNLRRETVIAFLP
jgi:hypothetical protein